MGEPLGDPFHLPRRGPGAQRGEQPLASLSWALCDHLDPPIGQVGRMAGQPQRKCLTASPPAKPHALNATMHPGRHPHLCHAPHHGAFRQVGASLRVLSVVSCSVRFVMVRQVLPVDLADLPPGPELARVLSGIDLARLSGFDCVEVLKARYRQLNHERARLMAAMVEVGLCGVGPAGDEVRRRVVPGEFAADEIRAALVLTRRAADAQFGLAHDLVTRLPTVHAAMEGGTLDEPRARVFSEWTTELRPEAARAVCTELLPQAPELTTGQLIEQIKKLAIALDPDWARRRYEHALTERKVVGHRNPDGSANLSGYNLPVDRVAAACGHIDALAKTAKHTGDPRPIDHIRAELFLGMTDGTYTGLTDTAILDHLRTTHDDDSGPEGNDHEPDGEDTDHNAPHPDTPDDHGPDDHGLDDGSGPDDSGPEQDGPDGGAGSVADQRAPRGPVNAGMDLRARLSTLLGRDQHPAELAGWGPLHAELARDLAATLGGAQWRFAITDEHGQLSHCGITQARPTGTTTRKASCRAAVELQIPATTLLDLASSDPHALGGWEPVVTDLAHQHTSAQRPLAADLTRRFPKTALRRHLEIRDRSCVMIGCRAPARGTDTDHTHDHARGGATTDSNLGHLCRHDHRLKHDGGWTLHQPHPGVFRWRSPLGHIYHRPPTPILQPLPQPLTPHRSPIPLLIPVDIGWEDSQIWAQPPPEPEPQPPPPTPDSNADIPPF